MMIIIIIIIIIAELHARETRLSIQEKFGYDVSVRSPVRTDAGGGGEGGRESEVSPSGEEYAIAEVKFCIFKHLVRFGGKSHDRPAF